jgi:hypothetical protein
VKVVNIRRKNAEKGKGEIDDKKGALKTKLNLYRVKSEIKIKTLKNKNKSQI